MLVKLTPRLRSDQGCRPSESPDCNRQTDIEPYGQGQSALKNNDL